MAKTPRARPPRPASLRKAAPAPSATAEIVVEPGLGERVLHCPIVGIGASAGGIEALIELFENLDPASGMAFVVVQHLAPDHRSILSEMLSRTTSMIVTEASEGDSVSPDHVYVIPPDREIRVEGGRLRLTPRVRPHAHPIDAFFQSLGADCGERSIGVVLSGTGNDGAQGLRVLKAAGALTFAQDQRSARFPEMPARAVASGVVDYVLAPKAIAREISRLHAHPFVRGGPHDDARTEASRHDEVLDLLRGVAGVDLSYYRQSTIRRRVLRRMALARVDRLGDYVALLRKNRSEVEGLYNDILINVTSFFRDEGAYKLISRRVLPALRRKRAPETPIRIWVAGCATGEEVYSISMCVLETLGRRRHRVEVQIFGTDASEQAVEQARAGFYPASIAGDVSAERLRRFFVRTANGYQVGKELRDMCVFAKHNLARDPPFSKIDFISCRNVLIYFAPVLQAKVVSLFHYALSPKGWLLLGSTEHVAPSLGDLFSLVDRKHRLYARKEVASRAVFGRTVEDLALVAPEAAVRPSDRSSDLQRETDTIVLSRYGPSGVVVDDDLFIVQFRGHTGSYLEPKAGSPTLNLLTMAREGLALEIRTAFRKARQTGSGVRREGIRLRSAGRLLHVNLEVVPLRSRPSRGRLFLVLFEPGQAKEAPAKRTSGGKGKAKAKSAEDRELHETQRLLQTIVEEQEATNQELLAANEEILSSNEELQSTNEELETAKEELQSSNEELTTVNEELQGRNVELSVVNDDLTNFLGSTHIPMAMLGTDLRVRRVTPAAEKLLNLLPTDVGRPVTDVRPNVEMPDLAALVGEVVESMATREVEVRDDAGRWYLMRVRPYKTRDHRIDGVVVSWLDLDDLRRAAARPVLEVARAVLDGIPLPAAVLGESLHVEASNDGWSPCWASPDGDGASPDEAAGNGASREWDDPDFDDALRRLSSADGSPIQADVRTRANGRVRVTARRLPSPGGWVVVTVLGKAAAPP